MLIVSFILVIFVAVDEGDARKQQHGVLPGPHVRSPHAPHGP